MQQRLMLKTNTVFNNISARNIILKCSRRHFLSAAFRCEEAWNDRLTDPIIRDVNPGEYYLKLDRQFGAEKELNGVWAIDLDLFANSIVDYYSLAELEDAVLRFRVTPAASQLLPSTAHAVIRHLLHFGQSRALLRILNQHRNYGIFLDNYSSCLAMDTFLKQKNFRDATKVAIEMMLQEDFGGTITKHMALYSCLSYLQSPQPEPWETEPLVTPEEPAQTIIIRLRYLPPDYFDDHFDLKDPSKLIGKTLAWFGKHFDDELGATCVLMGFGLYGKWDEIEKLYANSIRDQRKLMVFKEGITQVRNVIENIVEDEKGTREAVNQKILPILEKLNEFAIEGDMLEVAKRRTEASVNEHEKSEIESQIATYGHWAQMRVEEMQRKTEAFSREARIQKIREIKEDLKKREQLLFFFENFETHAMNVEKYDAMYAEVQSKVKSKQIEEEVYVPPDVHHKPELRSSSIYAFFLNHQGRVLYDVFIYNVDSKDVPIPSAFLLECDAQIEADLSKYLNKFNIRKKVDISLQSPQLKVWTLYSQVERTTDSQVSDLNRDFMDCHMQTHSSDVHVLQKDPRLASPCLRLVLRGNANPKDVLPQMPLHCSSGQDAPDYASLRLRNGVGEGVLELPPGNCFPLECNGDYLNGVSFTKGCYVGQELTSRTYHTGVVRKRLMPLVFDSPLRNLDISAEELPVKNELGRAVGKVKACIEQFGLGLMRIEQCLQPGAKLYYEVENTKIGVNVHKPNWWP